MSAAPTILRAALLEHGADPTRPDGLAWILRGEAGRSALPAIATDAEYVRAVRRILRRPSRYAEAQAVLEAWQAILPSDCRDAATAGGVDWRLLACGWHLRLAPSVWVARLPSFLRYWHRSAHVPRPAVVGSSHNADPLDMAIAWALRLPAHGGPLAVVVATMAPDTGARRVTTDRRKLVDAARALARSSARRRHPTLGPRDAAPWALKRLSISALAALGRLTPQLQAAAIERMMADDPHPDGVVFRETCVYAPRIGRSAIPWEHIAAERARGERYLAARYLRGRALCAALGVEAIDPSSPDAAPSMTEAQEREWAARPPELVAALVPGWATGPHAGGASVRVALRLARGDSVATVAADLLDAVGVVVDVPMTRAEEHAVVAGALADDRGARAHLARHLGAANAPREQVRSVAAMRWLAAVWRDPARREALVRERDERVPERLVPRGWHGPIVDGHAVIRMRYVAHLDELRAADLPDGPRTGVERAMRAAAERATLEVMRDAPDSERSLISPPCWWQPCPGVRLCDSPRALWVEGDELGHCVAGYVEAVQSSRSVIAGLRAPDGSRSTVEIDRATRVVVQHRSWRNSAPSEACERLLASMLVAWRGWS